MNPELPTAFKPYPGSLTDVAGIEVGHFTDTRRPTGCTVILTRAGAVAGVDVRGAAPGTRETDLLEPGNLVEQVHAVLLAGGSAWGLDAASGVMRWLEEHHIGLPTAYGCVPIVPAAVIFDLGVGDPSIRPDAAAGYSACTQASQRAPAQGSLGAGAGARVGKLFGMDRAMKGGVGTASVQAAGFTVAALIVCNAVGDVVDPSTGQLLAGARSADGTHLENTVQALLSGKPHQRPITPPDTGTNTTIGVIATDAVLSKAQAQRLARVGHDGLARTINPVHTPLDGDTLFALATGTQPAPADMLLLSVMAAEATARATLNAVRMANGHYFKAL
jgi:L-aminopeptidase/D-esterase-like protein